MVLDVPDEFRAEVSACSPEELQNLADDGRILASKFSERKQMVEKLVEAGWSPDFSDWYAGSITRLGPHFSLRIIPKKDADIETREYEEWKDRKQSNKRMGWWLVVISIAVRAGAYALGAGIEQGSSQGFSIFTSMIAIALWIWGLTLVLDSKGRSRWFFLIGLFVVLLRDDNQRIPPKKRRVASPDEIVCVP